MANEKIVIFHHDERGAVVHWSEMGELVRCRDCRNWDHLLFDADGGCYCPFVDHYTMGDNFCSDGERKENETD